MKIIEYPIEAPSYVEWKPIFVEVADLLVGFIKKESDSIEVHHIGSTSIPGCGGKGSIDLAVAYPQGKLEPAKAIIDDLGFQRQKTRNAFPESRPMRTGAIEYKGQFFKVHVHILSEDSKELTELIYFRDWLKLDIISRNKYVELKKRILEQGVRDSVDYSNLKGEFFQTFRNDKQSQLITSQSQFISDVQSIYQWLADQLAGLDQPCSACGRCCDFESFGHRLYVTTPELIFFQHFMESQMIRMDGDICPYRIDGKCSVYPYRFSGCRIFSCKGDAERENAICEQVISKFKTLCDEYGIVYHYVYLKEALQNP